MADLEKIKVGSALRCKGIVRDVLVGSAGRIVAAVVHFDGGDQEVIDGTIMTWTEIEAAEHIPAPKTFKRGDWVQWKEELDVETRRHCLVLGPDPFDDDLLEIHLSGSSISSVPPNELEPDEAPE